MDEVCAFAAEISGDRSRCSVAASWRDERGRVVAELVWLGHPGQAVAEIARLVAAHHPVAVVVDGRSGSATLLAPLEAAGVAVTEPTTQQVAIATGEFMDLLAGGQLVHLGQRELTEAVRGAQQRRLAGGMAWQRWLPVDQAPLMAATLAVWALLHVEPVPPPAIF